MSRPSQKPASVGRSCVVAETRASRGYSCGARNRPLVLFEIQQAIAQDSESMQDLARLIGHRAQILADDDHPIAHALQRENRKQGLEAIAHIGAVGGIHAVGNPVEPKEAHHVIDAQRAAVPAVLADGLGEQAVAVFDRGARSWAAETPSPGPWARSRPAARRPGSRRRRIRDAPTDRNRNGRWPAPGRDTDRCSARARGRVAAPRRAADRAATACTCETERCASVFGRTPAWRPIRDPGIAPASPSSSRRRGTLDESPGRAPNGPRSDAADRLRARCIASTRRRARVPRRHSCRGKLETAASGSEASDEYTRSYSTSSASRSVAISFCTARRFEATPRPAAKSGSPGWLRYPDKSDCDRRWSWADRGWCCRAGDSRIACSGFSAMKLVPVRSATQSMRASEIGGVAASPIALGLRKP